MNLKKYYIVTGLMALILSPLAVSIGLIGVMLIVPPIFTLAIVWILYAKKATLPENASEIFFPILLVFCYYMCVWIAVFGLSDYRFDSELFYGIFFILTIPYFMVNVFFNFSGDFSLFPAVNAAVTVITVLCIIITRMIIKKKMVVDKKIIIYALVFVCLSGIACFQHYDRSSKNLASDYQTERIQDEVNPNNYPNESIKEEVNLNAYRPFSKKNLLKKFNKTAGISFSKNYPKLDGATAAYPVYAAMAQGLYKGLNETTAEEYVSCTNTKYAYKRLISGEIDIFFGAQPSKQQIKAAKEKGVEFMLTPIAKEAFVFFVNKENPVNSLTLEQIQKIYRKKIISWNDLGGNNEKIMAFQRPEGSGSQTIMLAMVMGDKPLPSPLFEEYAAGMGGVISRVAAYRNYSSAIGYSFRFFATEMKRNANIKLLAINGIPPTVENIRTGEYPFIIDVYAVTAGSTNENTEKLLQWILSEQGQDFIETCGYVGK